MLKRGKKISGSINNADSRIKYFTVYTLVFAVTALVVNFVFIRDCVTYVRTLDGEVQHIIALEYYGQWLRDFFTTLFTEFRFEFKNFDFSIGMGSDVVTTFNYYAIGDPLNLLSVFVPKEYTAYLYTFLSIVRCYLAGMAFSLFCFERKVKNNYGVLAGSLLYAFSVFAVVAGSMHSFFMNPMIYLPLIFISIEKIFENKNPLCLALIVCIAEVSNFYFFYMLVFATVVYVLLRLFTLYGSNIKKMLAPLIKIAVSAMIGVLMGAVIFHPVVIAFLSDGRASVEHNYSLFYDIRYYLDLFTSMVYYNGFEPWTLVGSGVLVLYGVAALFLKSKSNTALKAAFLICTVGLCLPAFGGFSNGFSYASNRWCFIFTFVIAFACSLLWEDIFFCKNRIRSIATACIPAIYAGFCLYNPYANRTLLKISLVFFAFSSVAVLVGTLLKDNRGKKLLQTAVIVLNICFIAVNSFYSLGKDSPYHVSQEKINSTISDEYVAVEKLKELTGDGEFSRYTSNKLEYNDAVRYGGFATQYYWSLSDGNISDFQDSIYLNEAFYQSYNGFDDIAVLNTLSSVKYYYYKTGEKGAVPFGFEQTQVENLYENSYALPLVYAYDSYVLKEEYDALTYSPEKQQMLVQSAVVEEAPDNTSHEDVSTRIEKPEFEVVSDSEYVTFEKNTFTVTKKNSTVTLNIKNPASGEAYLSLRGISFDATEPVELFGDDKRVDPLGLFNESNLEEFGASSMSQLATKTWKEPETLRFIIESTDEKGATESRKLTYYTPAYRFYAGKEDFDLYLGYSNSGFTKVMLSFPQEGIYTFGEMALVLQNMDFYGESVSSLSEGLTSDITLGTDRVSADISLENDRLLCFSIPYSEGWTAYVDGEKQPVLKANIMHMAVEVDAGEHQIELVYSSKQIKVGALISLFGFVLMFGYGIWYHITVKKKESL